MCYTFGVNRSVCVCLLDGGCVGGVPKRTRTSRMAALHGVFNEHTARSLTLQSGPSALVQCPLVSRPPGLLT